MYSLLSQGLKDIIVYNHETFTRFFVIICFMLLSVFYIFVYKTKFEKPTPFMSLGIVRMLFTIISWLNIGFVPFIGVMLNPTLETNGWTNFYTIMYGFFLTVGAFALIGDVFYYIPKLFMRWANLDNSDPNVNKLYSKLERFTEQIMWGKNGKR